MSTTILTMNYRTLHKLTFPVFKLNCEDVLVADGLVRTEKGYLIDDLNVKESTLSQRRLKTPFRYMLLKIRTSIFNLMGILSFPTTTLFIDNKGIIFRYEKTKFCTIVYHKIDRVESRETYSLLWLKDLDNPIHIPRPPPQDTRYAGMCYIGNSPWFLYDYSVTPQPNRKRKI